MNILFEDKDIIVCHKPAGIAVQTAKIGRRDMVSEAANYLAASSMQKDSKVKQNRQTPYVGVVHRLDQPVEGILVFAKNQKAAAVLSKQIAENQMQKCYYAVVSAEKIAGKKAEDTLVNYLYKDGKTNTSRVVSDKHQDAKRAELSYEFEKIQSDKGIALVKINLLTGRHHQIRVQMSHAGMSLLGDYKYGDDETQKLSEKLGQKQVALCACELSFRHPVSGQKLAFQTKPTGEIFQNFL